MSHSWIERAFSPAACAGLAIGRDCVGFARLGAGGKVEALEERPLSARLFSASPAPESRQALAEALRPLGAAIGRRYLPLHVSVPDAAVRWATFELDEMPKSAATRLELARFRFARQGANGASAYACQPLERDGQKHLLLGMAMDGAWRRCITEAFAEAGLDPWTLNANACRQFNRFHDRLVESAGALLAAAPDAWSLWLWDERGRPRHARARWREAGQDHADIALEAERSILAYVHGAPGRSVERVFVAAGAETGAIADALDARLREPCTRLPAEEAAPSAALAIAAALER